MTDDSQTSVHVLNGIPHSYDSNGSCALCALEREMNASAATLNEVIAITRRLKRDTRQVGRECGRLFAEAGVPAPGFLYCMYIMTAVLEENQS